MHHHLAGGQIILSFIQAKGTMCNIWQEFVLKMFKNELILLAECEEVKFLALYQGCL